MELNSLRKEEFLDELCNIISESTGGLLNVQKIANTFQSKEHKMLDPNTIQRYLHLFEDFFDSRRTTIRREGKEENWSNEEVLFRRPRIKKTQERILSTKISVKPWKTSFLTN